MEVTRFDELVTSLGDITPRRQVLRLLAGGAATGLAGMAMVSTADAKKRKNKKKKNKNKKTNENPQTTPPPPQNTTCQPGTQVGAVSVPATGATVRTPVLRQGQRYRLRASGFWSSNATHGQDAFADFEFANPTVVVTTFQGVRLGLSVDGGSPDLWGSYNIGHVYEREITGQGASLSLRCSDGVHTDNSGAVLVEILCA
jgi:hypothetical protein